MVESMDYEIGRLLANIPQDELENTIIIFIGDNGTPGEVIQSPYDATKSKGSLYQGGIAVPLIVSGKGVSRLAAREQNLINATDLFSTIAQIAGVTASTYQNSQSFYPLLSQTSTNNRNYNYSEILNTAPARSGYTIRDTTYKLFVLDNGTERFYNLKTDPYETNNIMDSLTAEETTIYINLKKEAGLIRA